MPGVFTLPGQAAWSIKAGLYFASWYFFNIFYNVANKKALNALNLPWLQVSNRGMPRSH